jgi:hypothetical protein
MIVPNIHSYTALMTMTEMTAKMRLNNSHLKELPVEFLFYFKYFTYSGDHVAAKNYFAAPVGVGILMLEHRRLKKQVL